MVCIGLTQGVALLEGMALLEEVWPGWSRCGLLGGGVALLKCVCHSRGEPLRLYISSSSGQCGIPVSSCCLEIKM